MFKWLVLKEERKLIKSKKDVLIITTFKGSERNRAPEDAAETVVSEEVYTDFF